VCYRDAPARLFIRTKTYNHVMLIIKELHWPLVKTDLVTYHTKKNYYTQKCRCLIKSTGETFWTIWHLKYWLSSNKHLLLPKPHLNIMVTNIFSQGSTSIEQYVRTVKNINILKLIITDFQYMHVDCHLWFFFNLIGLCQLVDQSSMSSIRWLLMLNTPHLEHTSKRQARINYNQLYDLQYL